MPWVSPDRYNAAVAAAKRARRLCLAAKEDGAQAMISPAYPLTYAAKLPIF
jgi:hypothetical protein